MFYCTIMFIIFYKQAQAKSDKFSNYLLFFVLGRYTTPIFKFLVESVVQVVLWGDKNLIFLFFISSFQNSKLIDFIEFSFVYLVIMQNYRYYMFMFLNTCILLS